MNKLLATVGIVALVLWTGLGLLAWSSATRHVSVTFHDGSADEAGEAGLLELSDRVGALHDDFRALAGHLSQSLEALDQDFEERLSARAAALERELGVLKAEQAARGAGNEGLLRELQALRESLHARDSAPAPTPPAVVAPTASLEPVPGAGAATAPGEDAPRAMEVPEAARERAAPASVAAPRRKSFLAFELPSDAFRFDRRATWTVLPALSRVGFDARSTLHDFSGITSEVQGTLTVDPSRPQEDPRGSILVAGASLVTGVDGRDEALREHLATAEHPRITFELERFEAETVDPTAMRVAGRVHGTMTIRGVARPFSMPVRLAVDEARRLVVEGQSALHLPDFQVPVPSKLGVISMEEDVQVWISLKLRASAVNED